MAVTEMRKLTLLAPKSEADNLLSRLMWTGSVEVTAPEGELPLAAGFAEDLSLAIERKGRVEEALRLIKPYSGSHGGMFAKPDEYPASVYEQAEQELAARLPLADQVIETTAALQKAQADFTLVRDKVTALRPWMGYDLPLGERGSQRTRILLGTVPLSASTEQVRALIESVSDRYYLEWINEDTACRYLCLMTDQNELQAIQSALLPIGLLPLDLSEYGQMTASDAAALLKEDYLAAKERIQDAENALKSLGEQAKDLRLASDLADALLARAESKQKLLCTESAVLLVGWIPAAAETAVEEILADLTCAWEFSDPEEGEDVPVLLQNGKLSTPFESVVALYSMPAYKTFDPTKIMSIFYFIIFGLMFGDAIYGLVLILGGLLLPKKLHLSDGVKKMFHMFGICGFSSLISGILFGSYCGNMLVSVFGIPVPPVLFDLLGGEGVIPGLFGGVNRLAASLTHPMLFLVIALAIGVIHIFAGMGVKIYILCKEGKVFDAVVDVGSWYLIFIGIGLVALGYTIPAAIVAGIGVLMIVLFHARDAKNPIVRVLKGLLGLYDLVNYAADLMSYSRIMALGLASAVIAMVINVLAEMVSGGVLGFIFVPLILIVGHVVNIGLNLLGTFVHTSRLQYIEFFGKFYVDGGRQFRPLALHPAYTALRAEEAEKH